MKKNRWYEIYWSNVRKIEKNSTKAEKYILPILGLSLNTIKMSIGKKHYSSTELLEKIGYFNTYMEWKQCPDKWDNCCYILLYPNPHILSCHIPPFIEYLKTYVVTYKNVYLVDIWAIVLVLEIDSKWDINIKKIVKNGQYSNLGSKFAQTYFSVNEDQYKTIMKSSVKREKMEADLGVIIQPWVELESKPILENEILDLKMTEYEF